MPRRAPSVPPEDRYSTKMTPKGTPMGPRSWSRTKATQAAAAKTRQANICPKCGAKVKTPTKSVAKALSS